MELPNWMLASGLAGGGLVVGCWEKVKSIAFDLLSYVFETVYVGRNDYDLFPLIVSVYLQNNYKKARFQNPTFDSERYWVRPERHHQQVAFESFSYEKKILFWKGWKPIWYTHSNTSTLSFIRGTFDPDTLILDALNWYNKQKIGDAQENRFNITYIVGESKSFSGGASSSLSNTNTGGAGGAPTSRGSIHPDDNAHKQLEKRKRLLKWSYEDIGPKQNEKGTYIFTSGAVEEAYKEAKFWRESEEWFRERRIPWKHGLCFYGLPGTGKTSLALTIAQDLNLPIFVFDLASLTNKEFRDGWVSMLQSAPCIPIFEDVDSAFDKRKNLNSNSFKDHLTFDCILNCVDGVEQSDGVLLIVTTNKLDKLDEALLRPGRVAKVVHVDLPSEDSMLQLCKRILTDKPELWDGLIKQGLEEKDSMAKFQYRCSTIAQSDLWGKTKGEVQ